MKSILVIIIAIFIFSSGASQNFINLSKQIQARCIGKSKWKGISFHDLRSMLYKDGKLDFIAAENDTIYMLESYSVEDGTYTGKIWNRVGDLNYVYRATRFEFGKAGLFSEYTVQLLQSWDTAAIRKEESLNAKSIPEKNITGIRIIKSRNPVLIDCVRFREFFTPERDR